MRVSFELTTQKCWRHSYGIAVMIRLYPFIWFTNIMNAASLIDVGDLCPVNISSGMAWCRAQVTIELFMTILMMNYNNHVSQGTNNNLNYEVCLSILRLAFKITFGWNVILVFNFLFYVCPSQLCYIVVPNSFHNLVLYWKQLSTYLAYNVVGGLALASLQATLSDNSFGIERLQ